MLNTVSRLLMERAGFDPKAIGLASIKAAVLKRMELTACADETAYIRKIQASAQELEALVLALTVPETWFFREHESFIFLRHYLGATWCPAHRGEKLRILSIPCCTGEEPYSIAMTLLDMGMPKDSFVIEAFDINPEFLEKAKKAEYSANSFRGDNLLFRRKHFTEDNGRFRLSREVANTVHFDKGNILAMQFHSFKEKYPVVFCRNLLIYMHPEAQKQAVSALDNCIERDGLIFVGHAERVPLPAYKVVDHQYAFAYRRIPDDSASAASEKASAKASAHTYSFQQLPAPPKQAKPRPTAHHQAPAHTRAAPSISQSTAGCWSKTGISGDKSCEHLKAAVHCRNCPEFSKAGRAFFDRKPPAGYLEEWAVVLAAKETPKPEKEIPLLIFRVGPQWLALPSALLKRVSAPARLHHIPHSTKLIQGLLNVEGDLHLCFDMRILLGITDTLSHAKNTRTFPRTVIASINGKDWAFATDEILQIAPIDQASVSTANATDDRGQYAKGVFETAGRKVTLLDEELISGALARSLK